MKARIEKHEAESEADNEAALQDDPKALLAALPLSNPEAYMVPGEWYLERMGTWNFDPELFKEFEGWEAEIRRRHK